MKPQPPDVFQEWKGFLQSFSKLELCIVPFGVNSTSKPQTTPKTSLRAQMGLVDGSMMMMMMMMIDDDDDGGGGDDDDAEADAGDGDDDGVLIVIRVTLFSCLLFQHSFHPHLSVDQSDFGVRRHPTGLLPSFHLHVWKAHRT